MAFWQKLFGSEETKSAPALPAPALHNSYSFHDLFSGSSGRNALNIVVSPETAMRCTPVRAAVLAISEAVGQLPLITYERTAEAKERAPDHPVSDVLKSAANEITSAQIFRQQITQDALLHGNGYALINREGSFIELWRLDPRSVQIELDGWIPRYRVTHGDGSQATYEASRILHIRAPSLDGYRGLSPVMECRDAIELAMLLEAHGKLLFQNRAQPSGIVGIDTSLTGEPLDKLRKAWEIANSGTDNYRVMLIPGGDKFQQIGFSSVDSQYLELRQFCISEISRVFQVPPHMLFDMGRATWANSSEMGAEFLTYTLRPWLKRWEDEIALKLFGPQERHKHFAEFMADDFARMNLASRSAAYSTMIASRILSPNEVRARENLPPYNGGDEFVNPNTSTPADIGVQNG